MKTIKSGNIHSIDYDAKTKTLKVKFHGSEHIYHYDGVQEHQYKDFENAKSHGEHFNKNIRGKFIHKKHHGRKKDK